MRTGPLAMAVLAGVLGVLAALVVPRPAPAQTATGPARLLVDGNADRLRVHALYAAPIPDSAAWTYALSAERRGASTLQSRQSGRLPPAHAPADTLSTLHLSVQPGDRLTLHLTIRRDGRVIESIRRDTTLSPSE